MGHLLPTGTLVTREHGDNPPPAAMLFTHFGGPVATILLARVVRAGQEPPLHHWVVPTLGQQQSFSSATVMRRAGQEWVRQHPASWSKSLLLCLGVVRKWREIDGKRGRHTIPDLLVYFSHIN